MRIQNSVISAVPYRSRPTVNTTSDMVKVDLRISKPDWHKVKKYLEVLNNDTQPIRI